MDAFAGSRYSSEIAANALVLVTVVAGTARQELVDQLVMGCSSVVSPGRCAIRADDDAPAEVTVTWETATRVVVVARASQPAESERVLEFRASDPELDRWRAAGLVVAALSLGQDAPVRREVPAASPVRVPRGWVDAGGLVGSGLDGGASRIGGWARGALVLTAPTFIAGGVDYAVASAGPGRIEPSWAAIRLGLGASLDLPAGLTLRPRVDGVLVRQSAALENGDSTGGRWIDGLGVVVGAAFPRGAPVAVVLEGSATFLAGGTAVRIDSTKESSFPAHDLSFAVGFEVPFSVSH